MKVSSSLGRLPFESMKMGQSRGFTIVEMAVAMLVIAVVLAIATPNVARYLRSTALKDAVYQVAGDLNVIKSQAIRTQAVCQINFDNANHQYTLSDPNRTVDLTTYRGTVRFAADPQAVDPFSPIISIGARGISALAPPAMTQVYVTNQDNRIFRIQASAAGAVTIREFDAATNSWM